MYRDAYKYGRNNCLSLSIMDPNVSQNLTLTTDSVPWGPFSSQPDGFDDFSALFDSSDATSEPLDSTTFAEAQGLRMMTEFYHIVSRDIPSISGLTKHVLTQLAKFFYRVHI